MMTAILWLSLGLLAYVYAGYPALMWMRAARRPRIWHDSPATPAVSVVVVAHNEARRVTERIENLLALDYPRERLEIILVSDGSTDGTVDRARAYAHDGVIVRAFPQRRGKPSVLNETVPAASGDIVVLADARQRFAPEALRALVRPFADPRVGAVSGELILTRTVDATAGGDGVGFYWRYEKLIRQSESRVHSTVGATGAIYAVRRALFTSIPADTILDDVVIPMNIVRQGYRVLFESGARAYDRVSATAREEFMRKVRTIAGTFQLFGRHRWLLSPVQNPLWFQALSHKGARLATPVFHVTALVSNVAVAADPVYGYLLGGQLLFYGIALGGFVLRNSRRRLPLVGVPFTICLLTWATVVAFGRYVSGRQRVTWDHASA
jgi:cellulose synthase/poly-beta-1,6-N-acetylglucosamine synthase-like glycosyltransferase